MKKAIIHISDLHVCLHQDLKDRDTDEIKKFWLTTNPKDDSKEYINRFCDFIKTKYDIKKDDLYLLVTGDITNKSKEEENKSATEYLQLIKDNLKIKLENVLLLPGDHDVNWKLCEDAFAEHKKGGGVREACELDEKYKYFKKLYLDFTGISFDTSKVIVKQIKFENEKLIIIGINTNLRIDYEGGPGFVDKQKLEQELNELKIPANYSIVASFHHNIFSAYENKQTGSWDKDNRKTMLDFFQGKQIKCFFYGNEHTTDSNYQGKSRNDLLISSDSGSFSSKIKPTPSFKIYDIISDASSLKLKNNIYTYLDNDNVNSNGKWITATASEKDELEYFELILKKEPPVKAKEIVERSEPLTEIVIPQIKHSSSQDYSTNLFNLVKEKKLFHSGHFHWSETSRAHNWIDVTKILNNFNDLVFAKNAILDLVERNIGMNYDFVIGLGIEGNILSTKTAIKHEKPYSFLPYSYRYDGHNDFEREICFENEGKYKSVLIITDVVNDGRTIRKLIHKEGRAVDFFKTVEKIFVVSLFYTGNVSKPDTTILNLTQEQLTLKGVLEEDHPESRISYYFVAAMKVEECPYKADYKTACLLMQNPDLGCIHKFYDERKAEERKNLKINP